MCMRRIVVSLISKNCGKLFVPYSDWFCLGSQSKIYTLSHKILECPFKNTFKRNNWILIVLLCSLFNSFQKNFILYLILGCDPSITLLVAKFLPNIFFLQKSIQRYSVIAEGALKRKGIKILILLYLYLNYLPLYLRVSCAH